MFQLLLVTGVLCPEHRLSGPVRVSCVELILTLSTDYRFEDVKLKSECSELVCD